MSGDRRPLSSLQCKAQTSGAFFPESHFPEITGVVVGIFLDFVECDRRGADLAAKIGSTAPGTAIKITILRDGSERVVSVKLGELPVTPFKAAAEPQHQKPAALGLSLAPDANSQGVTITDVDPELPQRTPCPM